MTLTQLSQIPITFAAKSEIPEVCICFNDRLLRANRAVKINSIGLAAFESPNFPPLATLGALIHENRELYLPQPRGPFRIHKTLDSKILVLKLVPGFDDEGIQTLVEHSNAVRGIVIELYGTGNGPSHDKGALMSAISRAKERGIVCVAVSQCLTGGVSLETVSRALHYHALVTDLVLDGAGIPNERRSEWRRHDHRGLHH